MKKIEELKRVLNFYVAANTLKTKVYDEENNYTISDCLYGAVSLAIALDSEFKESHNVSRVIKMMLLDEFNKNNPDFDIEKNLTTGKELQELINEARRLETNDAKLAFKYRMMDFILTNLIYVRGSRLIESKVIEEAIKCFNPKTSEEYDKYREVVKYYISNSRLKDKQRSGWDKNHWNIKSDRIERIAEHIISTIYLAIAMESEMGYNDELDFDRNINIDEIVKMLSIHEIGETIIGDITPFDGITPEKKAEIEFKAVQDLLGNLTEKTELLELFSLFESKFSNEARFSYCCDKIEADLQSKFYQDTFQHRNLHDQETNKVMNLDLTKKLIEEGAKTPFDIWYGYDKNIYEKYPEFSEFKDLLDMIKNNNIIDIKNNPIVENMELTEEEHKFLTTELANLLKCTLYDGDIESILLVSSSSNEYSKGEIVIDFILSDYTDKTKTEKLIERLTQKFKEINIIDIKVTFSCHRISHYKNEKYDFNDILKVSKILLDKTGRLTKIQQESQSIKKENNMEILEYVPPIEEEIKRKMIK